MLILFRLLDGSRNIVVSKNQVCVCVFIYPNPMHSEQLYLSEELQDQ